MIRDAGLPAAIDRARAHGIRRCLPAAVRIARAADWQLADVSHMQLAPQSGSHAQSGLHELAVSHAQPPICSQRMSTGSHASPGSQLPPAVHAHPNAPIAQLLPFPSLPQPPRSTATTRISCRMAPLVSRPATGRNDNRCPRRYFAVAQVVFAFRYGPLNGGAPPAGPST